MASIKKDEIKKSIDYAKKNNIFEKLNQIYETVPSGKCEGCAKCCMESVGINLTEFLNIYKYLEERPNIYIKYIDKVLDYYFMEYKEKKSCPFLDNNNMCSIYEVRPLNCRLFGHWYKNDYNTNLDFIKEKNRDYRNLMKSRYGFEISEDVVEYRIEYCEKFLHKNGKRLLKEERLSYLDQIMILDSQIYSKGMINIDFRDRGVVEYFIDSLFFTDTAYNIKIKISQDFDKGEKVLKRIKKIVSINNEKINI